MVVLTESLKMVAQRFIGFGDRGKESERGREKERCPHSHLPAAGQQGHIAVDSKQR